MPYATLPNISHYESHNERCAFTATFPTFQVVSLYSHNSGQLVPHAGIHGRVAALHRAKPFDAGSALNITTDAFVYILSLAMSLTVVVQTDSPPACNGRPRKWSFIYLPW